MYVEAGTRHHRPHFHAHFQGQTAVFAVDTLECLAGDIPPPQQRLVAAWGTLHRRELEMDWALLQSGRPPLKIDPWPM